jgi:UDP-glucose 4-epimerase
VFGHGSPTRDYVHVSDVASALYAACGVRGTFNVATGVETDVMTIWRTLAQAAASDLEPELAPLRPGELQRSCMDPSRARVELGWQAEVSLAQGLEETYDALIAEFKRDDDQVLQARAG